MSKEIRLGTVAIIGVGLIGGSLAKALKGADATEHIIGLDDAKSVLHRALALNVIDEIGNWSDLSRADIIILATPVDALFAVFQQLATVSLKPGAVVSDVGSTKTSVLAALQNAFGHIPAWFVPAHPIAGREKSGVDEAVEDLFVRHKVIVTTLAQTDDKALGTISKMWHAVGAEVTFLPVAEHDAILGATSHLPHVLAYLLVDMLAQDLNHDEIFHYAAGGFRDFTRIASSDPVMWRDICIHNPEVLQDLLRRYRERIAKFEYLLMQKDRDAIEQLFQRAKTARDNHYNKIQNE